MEKLKQIAAKIDGLSLRERAIVFVGIIAILYSVWDTMLLSPLATEQKQLISELNAKNEERLVLNTRMQALIKDAQEDPDAANLAKLKSLRSQLIDVQAGLEDSTANLVTPQEMPKVLESVLYKTGGLTLLKLKSMGVTPLVEQDENDKKKTSAQTPKERKITADNLENAYRHGLRIEFLGDYFTTMDYLKSLEQLEWGFFWDSFSFEISEYPEARAAIEIFTLSLNQEWIGV